MHIYRWNKVRPEAHEWGASKELLTLIDNFVRVSENEETYPDTVARFGRLTGGALSWKELVSSRRVVLLAEAGSGKTTEMKSRARLLAEAGQFSFYASVEDVGRQGLSASLRPQERPQLDAWKCSDKEGYFFIDSVDEARQSGIRLQTALRGLAEAILGAERRAHIVISGRYTDWQFRRDLAHLTEQLSIPPDQTLPQAPSPDELVISAIHNERPSAPPPPEEPIVVVTVVEGPSERAGVRFHGRRISIPG